MANHIDINVNSGKMEKQGRRGGAGWIDTRSFVDVMMNRKDPIMKKYVVAVSKTFAVSLEEEDVFRYGKAFTGVLRHLMLGVEMKKIFIKEGIFSIRVTPMGPNLCLLEDLIHGGVEMFIEERKEWWENWFCNIRAWKPTKIDAKRFIWVKFLGIPCHAWGIKMFKLIAKAYGTFIKCDEQTIDRVCLDEAKFLIKSKHLLTINEACNVMVDGESFKCFVKENPTVFMKQPIMNLARDWEGGDLSDQSLSSAEAFSQGNVCGLDNKDSNVLLKPNSAQNKTGEADERRSLSVSGAAVGKGREVTPKKHKEIVAESLEHLLMQNLPHSHDAFNSRNDDDLEGIEGSGKRVFRVYEFSEAISEDGGTHDDR